MRSCSDWICRASTPLDAYTLAEQHETNPRSVWGYVQGLTTTQPAHALAGRAVHPRPSRQPPARHGPLTLAVRCRAGSARTASSSDRARPVLDPTRAPARDSCRARGCLRSQSPGAQRRCVRCAIRSVFTHDSPSLTASRINPFTR